MSNAATRITEYALQCMLAEPVAKRIALTRDLARISGSPTEAKRLEKIASKFSAGEIEHERLIEELRRGKLRE